MPRSLVGISVSAGVLVLVAAGSSVVAMPAHAAAAPSLTSVTPARGTSVGGQPVLLRGQNLGGVTSVTFGSKAAASVDDISATLVGAVAPTGTGGRSVPVVVHTDHGDTAPIPFTYVAPPALTSSVVTRRAGPKGIDCPAPGWCAALEDPASFRILSNGTWTELDPGFGDVILSSISCGAVGRCVAVGEEVGVAGDAVVVELNGTDVTKTVLVRGDPEYASAQFDQVSCGSPTNCAISGELYIVGAPGPEYLLYHSGTPGTWHDESTYPQNIDHVDQLSCTPILCALLSTEQRDAQGNEASGIYVRSAGRWNQVPLAAAPNGAQPQLSTLACHQDECVAAGLYDGRISPLGVLEFYADGALTAENIPPPANTPRSPHTVDTGYISELACGTGTTCVGIAAETSVTVITGSSARTLAIPVPASSTPTAVSCGSGSSCVIGGTYSPSESRTAPWLDVLYQSVWSPRHVAAPAASSSLFALSCAGTYFCGAQGQSSGSTETLATVGPATS